MPYWENVTRSFRIAWDHKYLWLVALFSGEGGGGGSYSYNSAQRTTPTPGEAPPMPDFSSLLQQAQSWVNAHVGLLIGVGVAWLILAIAFFILAAVCEGATVRGSAEHDAGRPFGLRLAWRMGVHRMWAMVRFKLLILLLNLPILALSVGFAVVVVAAILNHSQSAAAPLVLGGAVLSIVWIVYSVYVAFLDRFGTRALVLEELKARSALIRGHRLLFKRLGRSLLVMLLAIVVAFVVSLVLGCVLLVVVAPFLAIGAAIAGAAGSSGPPVALIVLAVVILLPLSLLIGGFWAAQGSIYWTLAFRRLDIDYAPAYGYPVAPATPANPQA